MSSSGLTNSMIKMSNNNYNNNSLQIKQEDKFFSRLLSKESSSASPSSRRLYYAGLPGSVPFLWESQPGTPKNMGLFRDDHHHDLLRGSVADRDDDHLKYSLPPLTPPPSYFNTNNKKKKTEKLDHHDHRDHHHHHKRSRSLNHLLSSIFNPKRLNIGYQALVVKLTKPPSHNNLSQISPSKSGSESSSMLEHQHHCFGSPTTPFRARSASSWFSSSSSTTSFDSRGDQELEDHHHHHHHNHHNHHEVGDINDDRSPNSTLCFFGCYRR